MPGLGYCNENNEPDNMNDQGRRYGRGRGCGYQHRHRWGQRTEER